MSSIHVRPVPSRADLTETSHPPAATAVDRFSVLPVELRQYVMAMLPAAAFNALRCTSRTWRDSVATETLKKQISQLPAAPKHLPDDIDALMQIFLPAVRRETGLSANLASGTCVLKEIPASVTCTRYGYARKPQHLAFLADSRAFVSTWNDESTSPPAELAAVVGLRDHSDFELGTHPFGAGKLKSVVVSPQGPVVASIFKKTDVSSYRVLVWDMTHENRERLLSGPPDRIFGAQSLGMASDERDRPLSVRFSPDGGAIAVRRESSVEIWQKTAGDWSQTAHLWQASGGVTSAFFSSCGSQLVTTLSSGKAFAWEKGAHIDAPAAQRSVHVAPHHTQSLLDHRRQSIPVQGTLQQQQRMIVRHVNRNRRDLDSRPPGRYVVRHVSVSYWSFDPSFSGEAWRWIRIPPRQNKIFSQESAF